MLSLYVLALRLTLAVATRPSNCIHWFITLQNPEFYTRRSAPITFSIRSLVCSCTPSPPHRRIGIGCIILGDELKRTRAATEGFHLMIKHTSEDLGYHRVDWKADNPNRPSLSVALRLGFVHKGISLLVLFPHGLIFYAVVSMRFA